MEKPYPYSEIRDFLVAHYDNNELADLFFDLSGRGVDLLGEGLPLKGLAREMVTYFTRREELPSLLAAMRRTRETLYARTFPQFLSPAGALGLVLRPGEDVRQQDEVESVNLPRVQKEGGYLIDEPPADWVVDELTTQEAVEGRLGADVSKDAFIDADRFETRDILRVRSQAQLRIEPEPGVSLINGRPTLSFLTEIQPVAQLVIVPLERQSVPPSFAQQSLEHIFLMQLIPTLQVMNLKSLIASTTRNTNRLRLTAELDQRVEKVGVDGHPNQSLTINQTSIAIQGYTRDYVLIISYISQSTSNKTEIEKQRALLQSLVDSFKLIRPVDVEQEERRLAAAGDTRYKKYVELKAGGLLQFQFNVLASQWRELDWTQPESAECVRSDARLIQKAIKAFPVEDEGITEIATQLTELEQMTPAEIRGLFVTEDNGWGSGQESD